MTLEELGTRYQRLRIELARAYEAPVWDSARIDGLTDAIADTESAIATSGAPEAFSLPMASRFCPSTASVPF